MERGKKLSRQKFVYHRKEIVSPVLSKYQLSAFLVVGCVHLDFLPLRAQFRRMKNRRRRRKCVVEWLLTLF